MIKPEDIQVFVDSIALWGFSPEEFLKLPSRIDELEKSGVLTEREAYFIQMSLGITTGVLAKVEDEPTS